MKRSVLIMLSSLLILLTACRGEPPVIQDTFKVKSTVSSGDAVYEAVVSRSHEEVAAEFTSPPSIAGIRCTYDAEEMTVSYGDLSCITSAGSLPPSSVPAVLCEALSRLDEAEYISSSDGSDRYRLRLSSGEVSVTCSGGVPTGLSAEWFPYSVTLSQNKQ